MRYFVSILVLQSSCLGGASCFALFVFLMSRDGGVALRGCLQFVIAVLPDHTHLLFRNQVTLLI